MAFSLKNQPPRSERDARNGTLRETDARVLDIHIRLVKQLDDFIATAAFCPLRSEPPSKPEAAAGEKAVPIYLCVLAACTSGDTH